MSLLECTPKAIASHMTILQMKRYQSIKVPAFATHSENN